MFYVIILIMGDSMNNEKEIKKSNLKVRIYIVVFVSILLLALTSYGYFYVSKNQSDRNRLTGGCFNTSFTDGDSISVENAIPMTEKEGQQTSPYHFTLTNSCDARVKYYVILNVKDNSFSPSFINVSVGGGYSQRLDTMPTNTMDGTIDTGYTSSYIIKTGLLNRTSVTENIRLWVNENVTPEDLTNESNSGFTAKIKVVSTSAPEGILGTTKIMNLVSGEPINTTDVITKAAPSGANCTNTLAYDGTTDNNLRYVGADPCNYVTFNNEKAGWRIVGIMNNVDDGTGKQETRIKLIRATSLGSYSWDTSDSSINSGYGISDWTQADLKNELNGDYLDTSLQANTNWYNGSSNAQTGVYDYTKGLTSVAQAQIGNAKWYLGGHNTEAERIPSIMYTLERGTKVWGSTSGQTCNDGACPRATEWTGKVALIYPSDYGYATAGGTTTNRSACIGTLSTYSSSSGETWQNSGYSDCKNNDWLEPSSGYYWLLSPYSNSASSAFYVRSTGYVSYASTRDNLSVRPAVYLESSVTISGGNGTPEKPYELR